jgi:hypothetical protein
MLGSTSQILARRLSSPLATLPSLSSADPAITRSGAKNAPDRDIRAILGLFSVVASGG